MGSAWAVGRPAPPAAPISSSKYGKCHFSGDSTTPSRDMKKFDLILRTRGPPGFSAEHGVHLGDGPRELLEGAPALEQVHVLGGLEHEPQLHAGAAAVALAQSHADRRGRGAGLRRPVVV